MIELSIDESNEWFDSDRYKYLKAKQQLEIAQAYNNELADQRDQRHAALERETKAVERAVKALGMISQLESLPLSLEKEAVVKKHNVMGSFANEALAEINEIRAGK